MRSHRALSATLSESQGAGPAQPIKQDSAELIDGELELGVISYDPGDDTSGLDGDQHGSPGVRRFAPASVRQTQKVSITDLGRETFIAHNVVSPYREVVLREFQRHKVPLNMDVEMPTVETIRRLVQHNQGVAFLPRMCVEKELEQNS